MALIECPECSTEVSDKAQACPRCSYPIAATTIEATGKRWKGMKLLGLLLTVLGLAAYTSFPDLGGVVATVGVLAVIAGGLGGWWEHG